MISALTRPFDAVGGLDGSSAALGGPPGGGGGGGGGPPPKPGGGRGGGGGGADMVCVDRKFKLQEDSLSLYKLEAVEVSV